MDRVGFWLRVLFFIYPCRVARNPPEANLFLSDPIHAVGWLCFRIHCPNNSEIPVRITPKYAPRTHLADERLDDGVSALIAVLSDLLQNLLRRVFVPL